MHYLLLQQTGLLLLALVAMILGGKALLSHPARTVVTLAFVYGILGSMTGVYYASTMRVEPTTVVFRWGLDPLLPALMVYLGLGLCGALVLGWVAELRQRELRLTAMRRLSIIVLYTCALAAVALTIRIPIWLQAAIDPGPY